MEGLGNHQKETRPWGTFERFTLNEQTTVKIITVNAGEAFSLQTHAHRREFWRVLSGSGTIRIGETDMEVTQGDTFTIPEHTPHRATAGHSGLVFLEIAFGDFNEDDITRLEDRYGRA